MCSSDLGVARLGRMEPRAAVQPKPAGWARAAAALRRRQNWVQLVQFCVVGGIGYLINLGVYTALVHGAEIHYLSAAALSFVVTVSNNYLLNRYWTFRRDRGRPATQGVCPACGTKLFRIGKG